MKDLVASIDLGGTKIAVALLSEGAQVLAQQVVPTDALAGPAQALEKMQRALSELVERYGADRLDSIVIGAPGLVDYQRGTIAVSPNLPGWRDVPLKATLQRHFPAAKVELDNDANLAALGESVFGRGTGYRNFVYLTVSTGIGGGIIREKALWHGASGDAGEIGHLTVLPDGPLCGCGKRGCLEVMASGTALTAALQAEIHRFPDSALAARATKEGADTKVLHAMLLEGNTQADRLWRRCMRYLAIGLSQVIHVYNPDAIILGGGISHFGQLLLDRLKADLPEFTWARPLACCALELAAADSAHFGAWAWARSAG